MLSKLPKNLPHRRRMPPLSRNRLLFSSLMSCCPSVFLRPRPTVLFRCLYRPLMSRCLEQFLQSRLILLEVDVDTVVYHTSLHAARSAFDFAVVCLAFNCRRSSRIFVQHRQEGTSHCRPFTPPEPAWYPSCLREYRMRRPENGFRELLSLRHAVSPVCYLVDVSNFRITRSQRNFVHLASVEWPGCLRYTAVVEELSSKIHSGN